MYDLPFLMSNNDEDKYVVSSLGRLGEALLATNPRTYMQMLSYTNIGYYLIQNGRFILITLGLAKMMGYTMEEILALNPLDLVTSADREMVIKLTNELSWQENQPSRCICQLITKSGERLQVQLENIPIKVAAQRAYHGLIINIDDLIKHDERIHILETARTIIDINDGMVVCDYHSGLFLDINRKMSDIFGYSRDELMQFSLYDLYMSDSEFDRAHLKSIIKKLEPEQPEIIEWPLKRKDGSVIWIKASLIYSTYNDREVILITLRDVTERHHVTDQLRQSEDRFKLAASLSTDLIYEENCQTGELFWHGDIDTLLGYSKGAFPRTIYAWKQVIAPEMLPAVQTEIDRSTAQGEFFQLEYQVLKQNGQRIWISERGRNLTNGDGEYIRCIGTITNINDLKQANEALQQNEKRFRLLTENARDIIFSIQIRPKLKFEYLSPALTRIFGYQPEELYENPMLVMQVIEHEHRGLLELILDNKVDFSRTWLSSWKRADGKTIWTEQNATAFDYGERMVIQGVARDVTENKLLEDRMRYMATHDALTGLLNRGYFEEQLERLQEDNLPHALIVCDLDGLKLLNDTLGHQMGDHLLKATAEILLSACNNEQIAARIGGDEFALLLTVDNLAAVLAIIDKVNHMVIDYNLSNNTYLSLSMGYAVSGIEGVTNNNLFKEADNRMYQQKFLNTQSIRNSIFRGLTHTLQARDFQTEGHSERIQTLVLSLARAIPLTENRMNDLRLLAQFHDIGKVGIPDHILFKPDALNQDEYEIMKRHSEIGYRIAQSVSDMATVSDWILKHHEWWNGQGYPLGLKEEEIPIECRILSIVDAYDAMTNNRPYRQAMSSEAAIQELVKGKGTQFDPRLVDLFLNCLANNQN